MKLEADTHTNREFAALVPQLSNHAECVLLAVTSIGLDALPPRWEVVDTNASGAADTASAWMETIDRWQHASACRMRRDEIATLVEELVPAFVKSSTAAERAKVEQL